MFCAIPTTEVQITAAERTRMGSMHLLTFNVANFSYTLQLNSNPLIVNNTTKEQLY